MRNTFKKGLLAVGTAASLLVPFAARAQVTIDTGIGSTFGIGSTDLRSTVINIVNYVLGLLGLIAVIIIIYAGVIWLTASGNEERVDKAKKILSAAVVGLIVVLLAWAIVIFVVGTTTNVTS
jgi:cytochrome bd-type quinol oxidase subunit 2